MQIRQADAPLIKPPDDAARNDGEIAQGVDHGDPAVGSFIQAYLRGEIQFGVRCVLPEQPQYGFLIGAAHPSDGQWVKELKGFPPHAQSGRLDEHGKQPRVLANNVETMERVKNFVPSLVWLDRFDDVSFLGGKGLYKFTPFVLPSGEMLSTRGDGKVRIINQVLAVACGEHRGENVEAASHDVDVSPGLDIERERDRLFFSSNYDIVRNIRWLLYDGYVHVRIEPSIQFRLKGWELGYGPIDRGIGM